MPDIDFDRYTLIAGWVYVPDTNYFVENQSIIDNQEYYTLTLPVVWYREMWAWAECINRYYWVLFPKLTDKPIHTEIIKPENFK